MRLTCTSISSYPKKSTRSLLDDPNMQFDVGIGAEAIKQLLHELAKPAYERPDNKDDRGRLLDLPGLKELSKQLREELACAAGSQQKRAKIIKRLRLVEALDQLAH